MFQNLRQGSLFYVLDKDEEPKLKIGQVISVSQPTPKYNTSFPAPTGFEMVVDVSVKVDSETMDFKGLPSNLSIANFGARGMVVSESKEAMSAEVESMLKTSQQAIDSIPYHQKVLASCDDILRELNPQFAKEKEQEEKIGALENKIVGMESSLSEIRDLLLKSMNNPKDKKS